MEEIISCPFCSCPATLFQSGSRTTGHGESSDTAGVKCTQCPAEISFLYYSGANVASRQLTAIELWNKRV